LFNSDPKLSAGRIGLQAIPLAVWISLAELVVDRAGTALIRRIGAGAQHISQEIIGGRVERITGVLPGVIFQAAAARFLIDGCRAETTGRTGSQPKRNFIPEGICRELEALSGF